MEARKRKERHRSTPLLPEVRFFSTEALEVRSADDSGDAVELVGYPIMYSIPYVVRDIFGEFRETMAPGVAADVLARGVDCRFLIDHKGLALGRTVNDRGIPPTLRFEDTPTALKSIVRLDMRQSVSSDLVVAVERGDVGEMSCGFMVADDSWNEDFDERVVRSFADLLDVSAVTYPASPTTSIDVATRMVMDMPVESKARVRKLAVDQRAGKALSSANAAKVTAAHEALSSVLEAAGLGLDEPEENDGTEANDTSASAAPATDADGSVASGVDPGESMDVRAAPTSADWSVESGLDSAKVALARVKAEQLKDPDNGTDPDDAAVMSCIEAAEAAVDKAIAAQAKDGSRDPDESKRSDVDDDETRTEEPAPEPESKTSRALWLRAEARKRRVLP